MTEMDLLNATLISKRIKLLGSFDIDVEEYGIEVKESFKIWKQKELEKLKDEFKKL